MEYQRYEHHLADSAPTNDIFSTTLIARNNKSLSVFIGNSSYFYSPDQKVQKGSERKPRGQVARFYARIQGATYLHTETGRTRHGHNRSLFTPDIIRTNW